VKCSELKLDGQQLMAAGEEGHYGCYGLRKASKKADFSKIL
jgi:hypothetical protein